MSILPYPIQELYVFITIFLLEKAPYRVSHASLLKPYTSKRAGPALGRKRRHNASYGPREGAEPRDTSRVDREGHETHEAAQGSTKLSQPCNASRGT